MEPILTTKLHIPAVHPNRISRPHLLNKLDENLWQVPDECFLRRLTLIAAPAGYGKSTLLGEWTSHLKIPLAWITFDETDNNPRRFYQYVVSALQTVQPGLGEEDIAVFQSPQPAVSNEVITSVMTSLVNEIAHVAEPFLLVFDDYHTIQAQGIHLAVKLLLDHLPENLSLVIATRADPPLPLSRLRARRQMIEVRSGDLRFSESEADLFLRKVMQLDLQNPDILTLTERTEGWIAGLQMAALALQGCVDPVDFIREFNGRERFVIDYLFEEVLSRQPEELQTFLIQTSILERMTGSLCDAVMGNQEVTNGSLPTASMQWTGQKTLEYLERANLFLVPLDNERHYYRYHHLFSDLLKHRLLCSSPDFLPELHARAAEWFEGKGQAQEAFDHWIAAKDYQRASNIVKKNGYQLIALGNFHQLLAWLERIPESLIYSQPWLCAFYSWALLFTGRYSEAERFLASAEKTLTPLLDQADQVLLEPYGHIAAARGYTAFHSQDEAGAIHYADLAMKYVAADDLIVKSMISFIYCAVGSKPNQYALMREGLTEVARLGKQAGNIFTAVNTLCILAELMRMQGKLHDAFEIYREAAGLAVDNLGRVVPIIASMYVGRARLHYEWDDFQAAEADILSASKIFKWYPAFDLMAENNILLAKLRIAQGDIIAAEQLIREIKQSGKQAYYRARVALLASEITLCIAKGDLMQLAQLIDQQDWSVGEKSLSAWGDTFIARAQVFIAYKEFDRAFQLLEEYRTKFESSGLWTHALKALVVQACTLELQGEYASAEDRMYHALSIAEPEGYIRIFVDAGVPAKSLVARCRSSIREKINSGKEVSAHILAYVDRLLSMFPSVENEKFSKPRRKEIPCPDLIDPLTERELEVLQLIADGFSNKEIAEKLVVTVGTVKTHTSNIYRKLDVLGRTKALAKARQLNLV